MKQISLKQSILNLTLGQIAQMSGVGAFSLIVMVLILIDIFDIKAADLKNSFAALPQAQIKPKIKTKPKTKAPPFKSKRPNNEVRQYSEFITVQHPTLKLSITTGIRYDNSTNRNITAQWCYASHNKAANDGFSVQLTVQKINKSKIENFAPYSVQTLRELNLTQDQARELIKFCRFKTT